MVLALCMCRGPQDSLDSSAIPLLAYLGSAGQSRGHTSARRISDEPRPADCCDDIACRFPASKFHPQGHLQLPAKAYQPAPRRHKTKGTCSIVSAPLIPTVCLLTLSSYPYQEDVCPVSSSHCLSQSRRGPLRLLTDMVSRRQRRRLSQRRLLKLVYNPNPPVVCRLQRLRF